MTIDHPDLGTTRYRWSVFAIFGVAITMRLALSLVNLEANDDHVEVIRIMAFENRIPEFDESWEAYQPKLYHASVAAVWRVLEIDSESVQIRVAQLVSCTAGVLTLFVLFRFLGLAAVSEKIRLLTFALLALNPKLTGINAQATNDSFVILFASLSLYFGTLFFSRAKARDLVGTTIFAILAGITKANGLVVVIAIFLVFGLVLVFWRYSAFSSPAKVALYGALFIVSVATLVPRLGPYWAHYKERGSPFAINQVRSPYPSWFEKTYVGRPGVTSVTDSFLTFRLLDMLAYPVISEHPETYPLHRTSVWSQLYGRTHFVHFDSHPDSWKARYRVVYHLGRLIFLFALFPTALLLAGLGLEIVSGLRWLTDRNRETEIRWGAVLLTVTVLGFFAFQILLSLQYRDYSGIKAIYFFPGLLAFAAMFARGCKRFYSACEGRDGLRLAADGTFGALLFLYLTDTLILFYQLVESDI